MNALPTNDWTFLVQVNVPSMAPRAKVEAFFLQVLKRPHQEGNEENACII